MKRREKDDRKYFVPKESKKRGGNKIEGRLSSSYSTGGNCIRFAFGIRVTVSSGASRSWRKERRIK
jgi:hypothetical protein